MQEQDSFLVANEMIHFFVAFWRCLKVFVLLDLTLEYNHLHEAI